MVEQRTFTFPDSLVTSVTDGDTLRVTAKWEQPFFIEAAGYPIALRVAGVDCEPGGPEAQRRKKATPLGMRAYERTRELCEGKRLTVVTYDFYAYGGPRGTVGEWVGDVFLPELGSDGFLRVRNLSDALLAEGLAVPYDGKGKRPSAALGVDWREPSVDALGEAWSRRPFFGQPGSLRDDDPGE